MSSINGVATGGGAHSSKDSEACDKGSELRELKRSTQREIMGAMLLSSFVALAAVLFQVIQMSGECDRGSQHCGSEGAVWCDSVCVCGCTLDGRVRRRARSRNSVRFVHQQADFACSTRPCSSGCVRTAVRAASAPPSYHFSASRTRCAVGATVRSADDARDCLSDPSLQIMRRHVE